MKISKAYIANKIRVLRLYIYIYIVINRQICFVVSELISVAGLISFS